ATRRCRGGMEPFYTAEATAKGDGRNGEVLSSDGVLDEELAVPAELGGTGGRHTNPEQLFAAGYAACFHGALRTAASDAGIDLGALTVTLEADLTGFEQGRADELVAQAHQICPYSNATRGNIVVTVTATT